MKTMILAALLICVVAAGEEPAITCIWLSYKNDPSKVVVNWETEKPARIASVQYGLTEVCNETMVSLPGVLATLHRIEIPVPARGKRCYYRVVADEQKSVVKSFIAMPEDTLRIAVVADWQDRKKLDALMKDEPHLLVAAGDLVENLHKTCGVGVKDCTKPFSDLIRAYPDLFSSVPFMPALGNHDREIRPRAGKEPPAEAVYDVDATAWRMFFELPEQEWMWRLELPPFDLQVIGLDLQHTSDMGTTYQSGHPFDLRSEQFKTYSRWMENLKTKFTVTILNEKSSTMRSKENGAWHKLFSRGTVAITGFGYFAERAEVDGFSYYNTALSGTGAKYPDPKSKFFASEDSYVLITATKGGEKLKVELKKLGDGAVLHGTEEPLK